MDRYLEEWVHGVRAGGIQRRSLGPSTGRLAADNRPSGTVNYGF